MRAVLLWSDEKAGADLEQPPRCLAPTAGSVPIDRLLIALRSVGISDRTAVVPKGGLVWGPRWHRALEVRGIEVIPNPRFQSARVAYGLFLGLEAMKRSDSVLVLADLLVADSSEVLRLAHSSSADIALVRPQASGHPEESPWIMDEKGKLKAVATATTQACFFSGLLKISAESVGPFKRLLEDPRWWNRPLGEAIAALAKQRTVNTLS
jgi:choline kinase